MRPTASESRARKARFLNLVAEGQDPVAARKAAGIDADRALRIVTEADYLSVVAAIREDALGVAGKSGPQDLAAETRNSGCVLPVRWSRPREAKGVDSAPNSH